MEKQRRLQHNATLYAVADEPLVSPKKKLEAPVEVSGVWHEPDGTTDGGNELQGGRIKIPMEMCIRDRALGGEMRGVEAPLHLKQPPLRAPA